MKSQTKVPVAPAPKKSTAHTRPAGVGKRGPLKKTIPQEAPKPRTPGEASTARKGRPIGAASVISQAKIKLLALHGQTPLEFLHAVFRDQLYDEYDVEIIDEAKGLARVTPKMDPITGDITAKRIPIEIERRIAAATAAAPYVHRKRPIGIDGGEGKALTFVSADQLAKLSNGELGQLLEVMSKLGIGAEFAGGEQPPLRDVEGD